MHCLVFRLAAFHIPGMDSARPREASNQPANWTVFILRNTAGRCFVGHTDDLGRFLATADSDVAKWTGQPGPWPLVWKTEGLTRAAALKYETSLKRDKNSPRFYTRTGLTPVTPPPQPLPPEAEATTGPAES